MKKTPILFQDDMVRAIVDAEYPEVDRRLVKTQTRRLILPQPTESKFSAFIKDYALGRFFTLGALNKPSITDAKNRHGGPGDVLWVRQTYLPDPEIDGTWDHYMFDDGSGRLNLDAIPKRFKNPGHCLYRFDWDGGSLRWKPSIHMPEWACRLFLRIEDIRAERVQDISNEDALAEGIAVPMSIIDTMKSYGQYVPGGGWFDYQEPVWSARLGAVPPAWATRTLTRTANWGKNSDGQNVIVSRATPREMFADLWDHINLDRGYGWDSNPWVWTIEFSIKEHIRRNYA